jgi:hypothetical protein
LTNNVKSSKETKIRKENTMVKKDDSSEPRPEKVQQILEQMPDNKKNWGSEICAVNEKESINKVLNSNLSNSSLDKTEQILTKNTEEKEHMESTTKEKYTR